MLEVACGNSYFLVCLCLLQSLCKTKELMSMCMKIKNLVKDLHAREIFFKISHLLVTVKPAA